MAASPRPRRARGVSTMDGQTLLTRIPYSSKSSTARARVICTNAPFDALYASMPGTATKPESEPTIVTLLPTDFLRYGRACSTARKVPTTLTLSTSRKLFAVTSSQAAPISPSIPAQVTSASRPPNCSAKIGHRLVHLRVFCDIRADSGRPPWSCAAEFGQRCIQPARIASHDANVGPAGQTIAPPPARYQRNRR